MDLEGIMLSKINQTPKYKHHMISLTCKVEKGQNKMNEQTKNKTKALINTGKKRKTGGYPTRNGLWSGRVGEGIKWYNS